MVVVVGGGGLIKKIWCKIINKLKIVEKRTNCQLKLEVNISTYSAFHNFYRQMCGDFGQSMGSDTSRQSECSYKCSYLYIVTTRRKTEADNKVRF